jgi:putative flippase GtrA
MAPLWISSYVLQLRVPTVSLTVENIADFISAYIIGNLMQMAFRFWAFRRWVFPNKFGRNQDQALESALTAGGFAEVLEDNFEGGGLGNGNVTLLRAWRSRRSRLDQLGDSSEPRVSKTS